MKRPALVICLGFVLAGLGVGSIEAGRWLRALALPDSYWAGIFTFTRAFVWLYAAFIVVGLNLVIFTFASHSRYERPEIVLLKAVVYGCIGIGLCLSLARLSDVFYFAPVGYVIAFTLVLAIGGAMLSYICTPVINRNAGRSITRGVIFGAVALTLVMTLRAALDGSRQLSFGGFGMLTALWSPVTAREYPSIIRDLSGGMLYGAIAGVLIAFSIKSRPALGVVLGTIVGAWVSGVLFIAHSVVGSVLMQTAFNERIAFWLSLGAMIAAGGISAVGIIAFIPGLLNRQWRFALALPPVVLIIASAWYVQSTRAGANLYLAALRSPNYASRVYIHFDKDGGWTRTFEPHADPHRIELCNRLLDQYPNSIYAAQALYLRAHCQFASWKFAEAEKSLNQLKRVYRDFRGAASLRLAYARLVQGRYEDVIRDGSLCDRMFAPLDNDENRLLLGHAYEVTGSSPDAVGSYTYYVINLAKPGRSAWAESAVQYAESRIDHTSSSEGKPVPRSAVTGRICSGGKPLKGVYIALVQPHIDASAPDDSRQFTGAITVPLWFGLGATTDRSGVFSITGVPYGNYEVVIGFETSRVPADQVISGSIPVVEVNRPNIRLSQIDFAPCVKLETPLDGSITDSTPILRWKPLSAAAYYTVSITVLPDNGVQAASESTVRSSYQCWAADHLKSTSVKVSAQGFTNNTDCLEAKHGSLLPGKRYMWIVLAYDRQGRVISSSERYRLDRDPSFCVRNDDLKGGR